LQYARSKPEFEEIFQELETDWFDRADDHVAGQKLEIFDTKVGLVLTDRGTVPFNRAGRAADLPFRRASALVLPVGRNLVISLGPTDSRSSLDVAQTKQLNREQFSIAHAWAYSHPEDDLQ